ncbi:hypothetical protein BURK1_01412 [Burkholderiales bacterium]|nr:hypothetical protein BURK1_01412 [Burkholderiales bacterium]
MAVNPEPGVPAAPVVPPDSGVAPAAARPPGDGVALAFVDAEGAAKWADALPFATVGQAFEGLVGQLRAVTAAGFSARERATIAEVLRDPAGHLHTELARRYAGKPQPAIGREREAAEQAIALWQALWELYSSCLKPLLEGDGELAGVKAKLLQRGIHVGKQLVLVHGLARRVPPPTLWQELHAYYRLAEMLDCTVTAVSDDTTPSAVGISCYSTYSHALLLALADPCAMSVRQIELADRWLGQWARKVFPYAQQRETEGPVFIVDLEGSSAGVLVANVPQGAPASLRFGYPGKLATSVRGRLKRLAGGATPAELALGQDASVEQCVALLSHLDAHWYQAQRRDDSTHAAIDACGGGVPGAYFRVAGRTFDRQDPLGRLSYANSQHLATLGALTDYDRHKEDAERRWPWERFEGRYGWRDARVTRLAPTQHRWFLDQLVAVRDADRIRLGALTRISIGQDGELDVAIRLWPGTPKTRAMRPFTTSYSEDPPIPTILLGETEEEPASLIVPPRTFAPGRTLRSMDPGPERTYKLTRLVQRGADFERVAFEES